MIVLSHHYYPAPDDYNNINQHCIIRQAILPANYEILLAPCSPIVSKMHSLPTHITKETEMKDEHEMDGNDVGRLVMDPTKGRSVDTPALPPHKMPQQSSQHPLGERLVFPHWKGEVMCLKIGLVHWHLLLLCKLQP